MSFVLKSVCFPSDSWAGYVAGEHGIVAKTTNGAAAWSYLNTNTTVMINSVYFPKGQSVIGWIVGEDSLVKKTINGGLTWTNQPIPQAGITLNKIYVAADTNIGWVVGASGNIFKTINGGASWISQTSGTSANLNSINFPIDSNNGYIVGDGGVILSTINGGDTWILHTPSVTTYNLRSVMFPVDNVTGYAVGESNISLKTANAGATWNAGILEPAPQMNGVCFASATVGYKVGLTGVIYKTISQSGGLPIWAAMVSGTAYDLYDTTFYDANTGYAVGDELTILKTINGTDWVAAGISANIPFGNFAFVASNTGEAKDVPITVTNNTSIYLKASSYHTATIKVASDAEFTQHVQTITVTAPVMWIPFSIDAGDGDKFVYARFISSGAQQVDYFDSIYLDTMAPVAYPMVLPQATSTAYINVKLNAVDEHSPVVYFMLSNVSTFNAGGEVWQLLNPDLYYAWHLAGDINEYKTVYARFKDDAGNISITITGTIAYGNLAAPPKVNGVNFVAVDNTVTINWTSLTA